MLCKAYKIWQIVQVMSKRGRKEGTQGKQTAGEKALMILSY